MENISKIKLYLLKVGDLFLKGDFKLRYIVALVIIAVLTISQQILIQVNLDSQIEGFKFVQNSRQHIDELSTLKVKLLEIQTMNNIHQAREDLLQALNKIQAIFKLDAVGPMGKSSSNLKSQKIVTFIQDRILKLLNENKIQKAPPEVMSGISLNLSDFIEKYIFYFDQELDSYEKNLNKRLSNLRLLEFAISFFTLLILLFEAFFIFAPALEKLNQALAARTNFLSKIGHEIRNPMNSILGMAELIEKNNTSKINELYIKRLKISAQGLLDFLNNVIDYAKIENKKIKAQFITVNLKQIIEEVISLFFNEADKKSLDFYLYIDPNVPLYIKSDLIKVKYILINLLSNAFKFTSKGEVSVFFKFQEKILSIEVHDTGVGIAENKISDIFTEFIQEDNSTKRKYGGSGLGLAIVSEYLDCLEGRISVKSTKGEGSQFIVQLPIREYSDKLYIQTTHFKNIYVLDDPKLFHWCRFHYPHQTKQIKNLNEFHDSADSLLLLSQEKQEVLNYEEIEGHVIMARAPKNKKHIDYTYHFPILPWNINDERDSEEQYEFHLQDKNILICDDSEDNRDILNEYIKKFFGKVYTANSGQDCLTILRQQDIDIVFLDIQMPQMDGYQVIKEAKSFCSNEACFIAFTANNTDDEINEMLSLGFSHILNKPIDKNNVMTLLNKLSSNDLPEVPDNFEERVQKRIEKMALKYKEEIKKTYHSFKINSYDPHFSELEIFGHQLKGSAQTYGFPQIGKIGAKIEIAAKKHDLENLRQEMSELGNELEKI